MLSVPASSHVVGEFVWGEAQELSHLGMVLAEEDEFAVLPVLSRCGVNSDLVCDLSDRPQSTPSPTLDEHALAPRRPEGNLGGSLYPYDHSASDSNATAQRGGERVNIPEAMSPENQTSRRVAVAEVIAKSLSKRKHDQ